MLYCLSAPVCSVLHRTLLRTPLRGGVLAKRKTAQTALWQALRRFRTVRAPPSSNPIAVNPAIGDSSSELGDPREVVTHEITQAEIVTLVIPCLPPKCRALVTAVTTAILEPESAAEEVIIDSQTLGDIVPLLEGLTPMFSIAAMVPLSVVPTLKQAVLAPHEFFSNNTLISESKEFAPEVFRALKGCYSHSELFPSVLQFVEGLLERLATWADCGIDPPPFDPIPDSYNPELTGLAFRLTRSGLRGRVVRKYVSDTTEESKLRAEQCQKQFPTTKFRTGGLFR